MKILIYTDPWIVDEEPSLGSTWPIIYKRFIESFGKRTEHNFHMFVGDSNMRLQALKSLKNNPQVNISQISQKELKCIFANYIAAHKKEYTNTCSSEELLKMAGLIKGKLNGFEPDIIFYFGGSGSPALKHLFPDVPLIYQESSMLNSIGVYPRGWYLDICGMNNNSFISVFHKEILNLKVDIKAKESFLTDIRKNTIDLFLKFNPIARKTLDPDNKLKYILFLPLESSMQFNFFNHTNFATQFDLIAYILDKLDSDIGLVVKEHVSDAKKNSLMPAGIHYLKERYSNFIYIGNLRDSIFGSHFLLSLSDAVITVSSTMGMQSLLWRKPLFTIGDMHTKHYSDGNKIEDIRGVLEKDYQDKDDALYYLLNNYYIPHEKFINPEWMEKFMNRAIEKHQNIGFDFYEPVDTPENTLLYYRKTFKTLLILCIYLINEKMGLGFPRFYRFTQKTYRFCKRVVNFFEV